MPSNGKNQAPLRGKKIKRYNKCLCESCRERYSCVVHNNIDAIRCSFYAKLNGGISAVAKPGCERVGPRPCFSAYNAVCEGMPHGSCKGETMCDPNNVCFRPA